MRLSKSYFYTLREDVKDEDSTSGNLLSRAGMIKKTSSGVYMILPLGKRVYEKVTNIIREEMDATGAQELTMPALIQEDVYVRSGRRDVFGRNMFALKDRYEKPYVLGPTHEELFVMAGMMDGRSYKDFPYNLYQFQHKYRDETRPRFGLIRTREFTMKDAYSFDVDLDGLQVSYDKMFNAYKNSFDRMHLNYKIVKADTGAMGGLLSEEFQAITNIGEDTVVCCDKCDYASNLEISARVYDEKETKEAKLAMHKEHTPNAKTIEEVAAFFNKENRDFVKTLIYKGDDKVVAAMVRGDREVNETKLSKLMGVGEIELADAQTVEDVTGAIVGFAGPVGIKCDVYMDKEITFMKNFIVGANDTDYHYCDVNTEDFEATIIDDISEVHVGDTCPHCNEGKLVFEKGIEVGNTFKLGTKYAESLGFEYLDANNKLHPVVMGSYGIGVERCMAAVVEQYHDEFGITWPANLAPYSVAVVPVSLKDDAQVELANKLYEELGKRGVEVMIDDRDERPGVKFKDMELIGIPYRITVGKGVANGVVEWKPRTGDKVEIEIDKIVDYVIETLNA